MAYKIIYSFIPINFTLNFKNLLILFIYNFPFNLLNFLIYIFKIIKYIRFNLSKFKIFKELFLNGFIKLKLFLNGFINLKLFLNGSI